jgi:tRNA A-37 threonylcarbamoyl transferase component Bud32
MATPLNTPRLGSPDVFTAAHPRRRPSGEPPPLPRQINASGRWWLLLAAAVVVFWVVAAVTKRTSVTLDVADHAVLERIADLRSPWLTRVMKAVAALASGPALQALWLANLVALIFWRRWRHLAVWLGAGVLVANGGSAIGETIQRPRPLGIEILGPWKGFAMPSLPVVVLAAFLVCTLYSNVPAGRPRQVGKLIVTAVLVAVVASRLYLAQDALSDALFGVVIGVTVPLVGFRLFAPNDVFPVRYRRGRAAHLDITGRRHDAILRALQDQLGVIATEIAPFGLEGSGGSTPLRVTVKGDPDYYVFAKLYSQTHLRSDRWYKLGRTLLYGRLEDEKAFNTVRRLVQYEDYVLRLLRDADLPVPRPYGIVEITPEREYLVVMEFFDGAREIGEADVDDSIIDQGLLAVRRMWEAGLAHRDVKPANLLVQGGRLLVIDSAFAQVRPSPWRQAVDLSNMMLVLALRTDAPRVLARTRTYFQDSEIAEAFAATRGLTMPSQLRRMLRSQGRNLHQEFIALLPYQLPTVKIQRWSIRRVTLTVAVVLGGLLVALLAVPLITSSPL